MNVSCLEQDIARGGVVLLGILAGGVPVDPISDQLEMSFSTPVFRPGRDHKRIMFTKTEIISSLLRLERRQKDFSKFILNSHTSCGVISYSFGTIRQICSYVTVAPSKTIPVFRPKRRKKPYPPPPPTGLSQ